MLHSNQHIFFKVNDDFNTTMSSFNLSSIQKQNRDN